MKVDYELAHTIIFAAETVRRFAGRDPGASAGEDRGIGCGWHVQARKLRPRLAGSSAM